MHKTQTDALHQLLGRKATLRREILIEYAKSPSGVADTVMAETVGVDRSDIVDQYLDGFVEFGLLVRGDVYAIRPIGRLKTPTECTLKGHHLKKDIPTTDALFRLFESASDMLHRFMGTEYYYPGMILPLREHFNFQLEREGMPTLNSSEQEAIEELLRYSPSLLKFVLDPQPHKCQKTFRKLVEDTKQERMTLVSGFHETLDALPTIVDGVFRPSAELLRGRPFSSVERKNFQKNTIAGIEKLIRRKNVNDLIDRYVDAFHPTWMTVFDQFYSRDRYLYDFQLSDTSQKRLKELMLKKLIISCENYDE